jgi:hypothetical protein
LQIIHRNHVVEKKIQADQYRQWWKNFAQPGGASSQIVGYSGENVMDKRGFFLSKIRQATTESHKSAAFTAAPLLTVAAPI